MTLSFEAPWFKFYENTPKSLNYPDISMFEAVSRTAEKYPTYTAYDFFGASSDYKHFVADVTHAAHALLALGVKEGEAVTICLPNMPQALIVFYAVNRIGAVANMVHPLSAENEILFYLNLSKSRFAVTLTDFYEKFEVSLGKSFLEKVILTKVTDALGPVKATAKSLMAPEKKVKDSGNTVSWHSFMKMGENENKLPDLKDGAHPAAILYSGGTTGTSKGILLTNLNFNALAMQTEAASGCFEAGQTMLAVMPMFHGFGLGVCIHTMLCFAGRCALVPRLNIKEFPKLFKKYRPNYMAGVPTLYEGLLRSEGMAKADLSCLKGVFSGGDSLSVELKKKVDKFLSEHGADIQVREGYGTTECVTASCLTPKSYYREGSIGVPFPDMLYCITKPETNDPVGAGELGEICISGPTVMREYIDNPKETMKTLRTHEDGRIWLHTGDLGYMDADGFVYFRQRLKRMIITSGYNVYPSQIENVIDAHEAVLLSTVIGVKDDYKMQRIKAFIVLKQGIKPTEEVKNSIKAHCEKNIAKYALPHEYEFRDSLPKTLVGKVAYTVLEKEEEEKAAEKQKC